MNDGDVVISTTSLVEFKPSGNYALQLFYLKSDKLEDLDLKTKSILKSYYPDIKDYYMKNKIHYFLFDEVATTMTLASEFPHKNSYFRDGYMLAFSALQ